MCGRFTSTTPAEDLARYFGVDEVVADDQPPRWNVAPTDTVLGIVDRDGSRRLGSFRWAWSRSGPRTPRWGAA